MNQSDEDQPQVMQLPENLLGQSENVVVQLLEDSGWEVRIDVRDGETFMSCLDVRADRANLEVHNGKVIKISVG